MAKKKVEKAKVAAIGAAGRAKVKARARRAKVAAIGAAGRAKAEAPAQNGWSDGVATSVTLLATSLVIVPTGSK